MASNGSSGQKRMQLNLQIEAEFGTGNAHGVCLESLGSIGCPETETGGYFQQMVGGHLAVGHYELIHRTPTSQLPISIAALSEHQRGDQNCALIEKKGTTNIKSSWALHA